MDVLKSMLDDGTLAVMAVLVWILIYTLYCYYHIITSEEGDNVDE